MQFDLWSPTRVDSATNASPDELLITFDKSRSVRLLVIPALFDEANKLRRFTLSVMRTLDEAGVDCALPDWPGCNESLAPLTDQTLAMWRACASHVADRFDATHVLSLRAGALIAPAELRGWRYVAIEGPKLLAGLLRARIIAAREEGRAETRESLL